MNPVKKVVYLLSSDCTISKSTKLIVSTSNMTVLLTTTLVVIFLMLRRISTKEARIQ